MISISGLNLLFSPIKKDQVMLKQFKCSKLICFAEKEIYRASFL